MESEALAAHHALVSMWTRMYDAVDGARFESCSDLIVATCPAFPIPQFNGPWVVEDSQAAVDGLAAAIAEVEAAGAQAWVQTRSGHKRTQAAACELGLTDTVRIPGMVVGGSELSEVGNFGLEIDPIADEEIADAVAVLSVSFEAPEELFARMGATIRSVPEATWYVGRTGGAIVSTALGFTIEQATGIFNVATPVAYRRHGYGAALTARAARDGFNAGSRFAYLQSSDIGHTVYQRLGFRDVEEYVLFTRHPGS